MTDNQISNPVGMTIGQYRIVSRLGGGGMATVYRAHQTSMDRDVAIKVIKPELANLKDFTVRFEREAKMLASLSHANILKIFDYGQHQDMWYLIMELLSGGSLADRIVKGPLPLSITLRLFDQIASALDYAHHRGIVHRDLKPQNVLLDDASNALLTDFGLARLVNTKSSLTVSGVAVGTPSYMAPEQWTSGAVDLRADIYSLGIMLFEMVSGKLPFEGDTPFRLMHMHIYENPPSLQDLKPGTPPDIANIIARALAKQPDDRFQSAGEMSNALRKAVTGITSSYIAERPSAEPRNPVSSRNVSAPLDKVTLLPYDGTTDDQAPLDPYWKNSPAADHITLLPIDEPSQEPAPTPFVGIPAPFVDPDYPAKAAETRRANPQATAKAARKAQKQRNMNMLTIATVVIGVIVVGIFAVLLTNRNNVQAAMPTVASTKAASNNNALVESITLTPAPTETIGATNTLPPTSTRRPTWTPRPSYVAPGTTIRATARPTSMTQLAAVTTGIIGTILAESDIRAGAGSTHPSLMKSRIGDQYNIEGKSTVQGEEWFEITIQGGAPAWIIASAVEISPAGVPIPIVTARPPPPPK